MKWYRRGAPCVRLTCQNQYLFKKTHILHKLIIICIKISINFVDSFKVCIVFYLYDKYLENLRFFYIYVRLLDDEGYSKDLFHEGSRGQ